MFFSSLVILLSLLLPPSEYFHCPRAGRLNAWAIFSIEIIGVSTVAVGVPGFVIAVFAQFPQIAGIFNIVNGFGGLCKVCIPYRVCTVCTVGFLVASGLRLEEVARLQGF